MNKTQSDITSSNTFFLIPEFHSDITLSLKMETVGFLVITMILTTMVIIASHKKIYHQTVISQCFTHLYC